MQRQSLTVNQKLQALTTLITRSALAGQLGKSFDGTRDLYTSLGYPTKIEYNQFFARYTRQDIAKRIINAYPDACWVKPPEVVESEDTDTEFEDAWEELLKKIPVWHYMKRIDRVSGIGRYGVMLLGFDDGRALDQPVGRAKNLLYLRPFAEDGAQILDWETNISNERYGLPKHYNLTVAYPGSVDMGGSKIMKVHHSRLLHVADELTTDDVYGTPRLEAVYNRLQDLEMIAGGSAEMWWRGAFPGFGFNAVEGADFDPQTLTQLQTEIDDYIHGLKRYMRLKNIDIQQLTPQVADATKPFEVEITLISIATGIPKRILMGTERGELASSQDSSEWDDRVDERRVNYCAPKLVRPFIDTLIRVGVLPAPKTDSFNILWSPIHIMNEKEKADIAVKRSEAISKYAGTMGTDQVIPPDWFLREIMGFDDDTVQKISEDAEVLIKEEEARMEEEKAADQEFQMAMVEQTAAAKAKAQPKGGNGEGPAGV